MWDKICFVGVRLIVIFLGSLTALVFIGIGRFRSEEPLTDSATIELFKRSLEKKWVKIGQQPGTPLKEQFDPFEAIPSEENVDSKQYERLQGIVRQFVAAANWGLARPFDYQDLGGSVREVTRFNSEAFDYKNPFETPEKELKTPILASSEAIAQRRGWRIVGRELSLFLNPEAAVNEIEVLWGGAPVQQETLGPQHLVARSFRLLATDGSGLRISVGPSADLRDASTTCRVEVLGQPGSSSRGTEAFRTGEYFLWRGQPFAVYEVGAAPSSTSDLVITKRINGQLSRLNLLGAATNNLIGASWRGLVPYLEGALDHSRVQEVTLTLDPELQNGSFVMLRQMLDRVNGAYGIGRSRRGSVAILDQRTGAIRALAGYPSYDTDGSETRRILLKDDDLPHNPALEAHMAGSTIKVMTVSLGYLLYGQAPLADLLPTSDKEKAVLQAFQDAYGVALNAPVFDADGRASTKARDRFRDVGGVNRVQANSLEALDRVFLVSPYIEPRAETEPIISRSIVQSFFKPRFVEQCYPQRSHWPVKVTEDMDTFVRHALGTEEARFTTLRLAAILGLTVEGHVLRPYLVESVKGRDGTTVRGGSGAIEEASLPWDGFQQNRANLVGGIKPHLQRVLLPGGTGYVFVRDPNDPNRNRQLYIGQNDPYTVQDEGHRANHDYGKTGTADYGRSSDQFQDSLFVYRHGDYLIAVWLEQSDKGTGLVSDEKFWLRHPAHILTHRLVQLIEALESTANARANSGP